jgi:hypothetical protein
MAGGETPMAGGRQAGGIAQRSCAWAGRCTLEAHSPDLRHFHQCLSKNACPDKERHVCLPQRACGTMCGTVQAGQAGLSRKTHAGLSRKTHAGLTQTIGRHGDFKGVFNSS